MKFEDIIPRLSRGETICIAGGEIMIKRKLSSVLGGVPIYHISVEFVKDRKETISYSLVDELDSDSAMQIVDIRRCQICDELPEHDYYIDSESNFSFCCSACLERWLDNERGKGNWRVVRDNSSTERYQVKVNMDDIYGGELEEEDQGKVWRNYRVLRISEYDFMDNMLS